MSIFRLEIVQTLCIHIKMSFEIPLVAFSIKDLRETEDLLLSVARLLLSFFYPYSIYLSTSSRDVNYDPTRS